MNRQDWDDLYIKLYDAYEFAGLRDEYVRSTLGDALDHMIHLKELRVKEYVTVQKLAQEHLSFLECPVILTSVPTKPMETINRTDYSALDIIQMVLKTYENDGISMDSHENALWAISMIKHEVEQTGRTL